MHSLSSLLLSFLLLVQPLSITGNEQISDLLAPEFPYINNEAEKKPRSDQGAKTDQNLEELFGPKQIFPFLPDNHRDSGTGKFNAF